MTQDQLPTAWQHLTRVFAAAESDESREGETRLCEQCSHAHSPLQGCCPAGESCGSYLCCQP